MLGKGSDGQTNLVDIDKSVQYSNGDKVLLEPVSVWRTSDAKLNELEANEIKQVKLALRTRSALPMRALARSYFRQ